MPTVQTLKGLLLSRYTFILLGVVAIVALIMMLGPMLSLGGMTPLAGFGNRALASGLVMSGPVLFGLVQMRMTQQVNSRITAALGQGALAPAMPGMVKPAAKDAGAEEVQALAARFKDALGTLKKRRFPTARGRRWLYQLPWYVIIGPPGSGKTTAITNSGLTFPLAETMGRAAVVGVGGTRNCDWWFTDEAVLIDTAGRYTTQDSDAEQDRAAWLGFLKLLKRYRRRQPLNGVLVAIGISDLTSANEETRLEHAARIRKRVGELYAELGARLPVYMLFTKSDLIAGFVEYFDDLGREGREAVWGMTFPLEQPEPEGGQVGRYGAEFDALVGRLDERLLERVQQEGDIQRRALVFGMPQQVASLKGLTAQFLREAFEPNSYEEPIQLRGVYFVSGTQIGTPLDRVMDAMSQTFGVTHPPQPEFSGNKRSYFLSRLLRDVVFGEAWLVDADERAMRRHTRLRIALFVAVTALVLGLGGLWLTSYFANLALIDRIEAASATYAASVDGLKLDRVGDGDLRAVTPLLDKLRAIETGSADAGARSNWLRVLGLSQDEKLDTATRGAYRRALSSILLPRLILRSEAELTQHHDDPAFLYPALEVYLMLGRQGPISADLVRRWMALDWAAAYPEPADAPLRAALARHLDALLAGPFADIGLDNALIERTRATLGQVPPAQRVLQALAALPETEKLPLWRIADNAGPAANTVLQLRSGQTLSSGIPGLYTRDGYLAVMLPKLAETADSVMRDGWVLDPSQPADKRAPADTQQVQRDAMGLYLQEFALRWDHLLDDLTVKPINTMDDSLRTLEALSAPTSPIRLLLAAAAKETSLDPPPAQGSAQGQDALAALFKSSAASDSPAATAAAFADKHFKSLHQLFEVPPNSGADAKPPIDGAIADLGALYHSLTPSEGGNDGAGPLQRSGQSAGAVARLHAGAANLPDPIRRLVLGVSQTTSNLSADDAKGQLASLWSGGPGHLCTEITRDRYPFVKGAKDDVPLGDFARLFAPNGTIDAYFTKNLAPFVDMSQPKWRPRSGNAGDLKLDPASLAQFQRAAAIRDSLFAKGGNDPAIGFEFTIASLDDATASIEIEIDGQHVSYAHGAAPASLTMHWPASNGGGHAAVTFTPSAGGEPATIRTSGPWALFRLLDQGGVRRSGGPDRLQAHFTAEGHSAEVTLRADSVLNPLDGGLLGQFRCPSST